jgi:hypothetical protein
VELIEFEEMSPEIRQYREEAFGATSTAYSGINSVKDSGEEGSPNSSDILQKDIIENRIKVKKSSRKKKLSFDSLDEEAILRDFQDKEKACVLFFSG